MISSEFIEAVKTAKQSRAELAAYGNMSTSGLSSILNGVRRVKKGDEGVAKIGSLVGIKKDECFIEDFYLLAAARLKDRDSPIYASGRGILLSRGRERQRHDVESALYHRDPNYLLCAGAAVGICDDNILRHVQVEFVKDKRQRFCGFLLANQAPDRAVVLVHGQYHLLVQGLERAKKGTPVYCFGPNDFTTDAAIGGVEIGVIDYKWPDARHRASVRFRSYNNKRPFRFSTIKTRRRSHEQKFHIPSNG